MATDVRSSSTTIIAATAGVLATGFLAYAVYFDHRRRTDPDYRRALKRENKRLARAAKEEENAKRSADVKKVKELLDRAEAEGYPTSPEEIEVYFMQEVAEGEKMVQDGSDPVDAALHFYKALKVYPSPGELINIYDKTVPKPVIDILAQMIAHDSSIIARPGESARSASSTGSDRGVDD